MKRRAFLKHLMAASASGAIAYPVSKGLSIVTDETEAEIDPNLDLSQVEKTNIVAARLMEKYDIPELDKAKQLVREMRHMTSLYFAGGAFTGSAYRSANNEISPDTRRNIFHRACNIFAGGGLAKIASFPLRRTHDLTDPFVLTNEYGLPAPKAEEFCNDFRSLLSRDVSAGGATVGLVQEIFSSPPKINPPPSNE